MYLNTTETLFLRSAIARSANPRTLPAEVTDFLFSKKAFKLFVPHSLGGLQMEPQEAICAIEDCARADGDIGWAVQIGAGGGFFHAYMHPSLSDAFFSRRDAVIAGSGAPGGTAHSRGDGYEVQGRWAYASGADYATLFTAVCTFDDGTTRAVAVPPPHVRIERDWDAHGLTATGSHTIAIDGAPIQANQVFVFEHPRVYDGYPIGRVPFLPFAAACITAVGSGCLAHWLEVLRSDADTLRKVGTHTAESIEHNLLLHRQRTQEVLGAMWHNALQHADTTAEQAANAHREYILYGEFLANTLFSLYRACGLRATRSGSPYNKIWRDASTALQHALLQQPSCPATAQ